MPDTNAQPGKMSLYLDEARWRRDDQIDRARGLDRKLATMFALNAATVALFAALFSFSLRPDSSYPMAVIALLSVALASFLVTVLVSVPAYHASKWVRQPDLATLKRHLNSYDELVMITWIADEIGREVSANEERIKRKARLVTWSIILSVVTILLLTAAAAVALWLK